MREQKLDRQLLREAERARAAAKSGLAKSALKVVAEVGWAVLDMEEVKVAAWCKVQRWWRKDARNEVRERWELQETNLEKNQRETEALQWERQVEVQLRFAQLLAVQSILQKLHDAILDFW